MVFNAYGASTSQVAVLTVQLPPTILAGPESRTVSEGASAAFSVTAAGTLPLSYQWLKAGQVLPGATQASLNLGPVHPADAGAYSVIVSNGAGTVTSRMAFLTVLTNQPFVCTAANPARIDIRDNQAAFPYPSTITVACVAGSITHLSVTLSNFSHTFPGDVDCLLVGPHGQRVWLMSDAGYFTAVSGLNLTFDDNAPTAVPDADPLASDTYRPADYEPGDTLPVPAPGQPYGTALAAFTGTDPNGTWSLYVYDDEILSSGVISGGWSLTIQGLGIPNEPPRILAQPTDVTGVEGATAVFAVQASGTEPLAYQWRFNGVPLTHRTQATVLLNPLTPDLSGPYAVVVTNAFGAVTSEVAVLTVHTPPYFVSDPEPLTAAVGDTDVRLTAVAAGTLPLAYQWRRNGVNLVDDGRVVGVNSNTLALNPAHPADAGDYDVVVTNIVGSASSLTARLTLHSARILSGRVVSNSWFQLDVRGVVGSRFEIQASTNLVQWKPIGIRTNALGIFQYLDPGTVPFRFYRVVQRP